MTTPDRMKHRAPGATGIRIHESRTNAPFVRVTARNGRILAHTEEYSDRHEAATGADTLERTVIEGSHRSGSALFAVLQEMDRQDEKWGDQTDRPDGTGLDSHPLWGFGITGAADAARLRRVAGVVTDKAARDGDLTWTNIALEEVFEALAEEPETPALRDELVQAAAVFVQWAAAIDRRTEAGEL